MTSLPLADRHQLIAADACRCVCIGPATARRENGDSFVRRRLSPGLFRLAIRVVPLDADADACRWPGVPSRRMVDGFIRVVHTT
jgi:hypothetical protein